MFTSCSEKARLKIIKNTETLFLESKTLTIKLFIKKLKASFYNLSIDWCNHCITSLCLQWKSVLEILTWFIHFYYIFLNHFIISIIIFQFSLSFSLHSHVNLSQSLHHLVTVKLIYIISQCWSLLIKASDQSYIRVFSFSYK